MSAGRRISEPLEFVVKIDHEGDGYRSHVLASPGGHGSAPFVPPVTPEALAKMRGALDRAIRDAAWTVPPASGKADPALALAAKAGTDLYAALFRDRVRELFDFSRGRGAASGLRLKLRFDLTRSGSAWLIELPWELLRQPGRATWLSLDPKSSLVRYVELQGAESRGRFVHPLRVLAVSADPIGGHPLDLEAERQLIARVAEVSGTVEVIPLPGATLGAVVERLSRDEFHVLHFMGHGGIDPATARAVLLFEGRSGEAEPVSGEALANILQGCSCLWLAVLNACHSGELRRGENGDDPFAGIATTLVSAGLPAAVAMRDVVSDRAAINFSHSFYAALAGGQPLDAAVTGARRAMAPDSTRSLEWSVPVLFMREWDGRFFARDEVPPEGLAPDAVPPPAAGRGARIGAYIGRINKIGMMIHTGKGSA